MLLRRQGNVGEGIGYRIQRKSDRLAVIVEAERYTFVSAQVPKLRIVPFFQRTALTSG